MLILDLRFASCRLPPALVCHRLQPVDSEANNHDFQPALAGLLTPPSGIEWPVIDHGAAWRGQASQMHPIMAKARSRSPAKAGWQELSDPIFPHQLKLGGRQEPAEAGRSEPLLRMLHAYSTLRGGWQSDSDAPAGPHPSRIGPHLHQRPRRLWSEQIAIMSHVTLLSDENGVGIVRNLKAMPFFRQIAP